MKLLLLLSSNQCLNQAISKACCCSRTLSYKYSTKTPYCPPPSDNLRARISRAGNPNGSIVTVLDQWLDEGKPIKQSDLHTFIKMLRKFCGYTQALQMSEWMSGETNHTLSMADIAIRLDLILKVRGLEEADKYLSTPDPGRPKNSRYAMIRCVGSVISRLGHNKKSRH